MHMLAVIYCFSKHRKIHLINIPQKYHMGADCLSIYKNHVKVVPTQGEFAHHPSAYSKQWVSPGSHWQAFPTFMDMSPSINKRPTIWPVMGSPVNTHYAEAVAHSLSIHLSTFLTFSIYPSQQTGVDTHTLSLHQASAPIYTSPADRLEEPSPNRSVFQHGSLNSDTEWGDCLSYHRPTCLPVAWIWFLP